MHSIGRVLPNARAKTYEHGLSIERMPSARNVRTVRGWHCGSVRVLALSGQGLNPLFESLSVCLLRDGRRLKSSSRIFTDIRCLVPREFSIKFRAGGKFSI